MGFERMVEEFLERVDRRRMARRERELQHFADALDDWLTDLLDHPRPAWREEAQAFLDWQKEEGRIPTAESWQNVIDYLQSWADSIGLEQSAADAAETPQVATSAAGSPDSASGYPKSFGTHLGAMEEENRRRAARALPPLVDGPPEMAGHTPRIVEIKRVRGFWAIYDEAVATGQFEPNWLERGLLSVARQILPESEPTTLVKFDDGSVLILLGGGPDSGALADQATFFIGAHGAVRGAATLKEALIALFGHVAHETGETIADSAIQENTGVPIGPSEFLPKKGKTTRPPNAKGDVKPSPNVSRNQKLSKNKHSATLGSASSTDYRATFFRAHPELKGEVIVHHAVPKNVLSRYPGVVTEGEIHSLENLRGISKDLNPEVHLSAIAREWNEFYRSHSTATKQDLLQKATEIDLNYGKQFQPPIGD